jgi:hypothetical protein
MLLNRCLPLLALMLSACSTPADYVPAHLATPSPDTYTLALGNIQAQATLESIQVTSQAISAELTVTAYAPTQQSIETATERAWQMTGWTVTAAVEQTATAASGTSTAQAWTPTPNFTATVESAQAAAQATALHGQAVSVELAVERERFMNQVWAVTPWATLITILMFSLLLVWRWARVRPIQRDLRGDAPLLVIDGTVYDADRNPLPAMQMNNGQPTIPMLTPPEMQGPTTARDQAIDLARSLPTKNSRQHLPRAMFANNQPAFQVVPPGKLPPLLTADPQVTQILDAEWRQDDQE